MYRITVKGEAKTDYPKIEDLDGVDCQDDFTEYFHGKHSGSENEQSLIDKNVGNGYMEFKVEDGKLMTITTYESKEKLTEEELKILADYTQDQWSDGIGEGFEQEPCLYINGEEDGIYISPWHPGQTLLTLQEKI